MPWLNLMDFIVTSNMRMVKFIHLFVICIVVFFFWSSGIFASD